MGHFTIARLLLHGSLISAGFILLDAIWLRTLPEFDISFGPIFTSLFILSFFRVLILIMWLILSRVIPIGLSGWWQQPNIPWFMLAIPNLVLLGLGLYSFGIEPFQLSVSRIELVVPGLKHPQRIVQLSDLHIEFTTLRERKLSALVENLRPDMIVLTGDYVNESFINEPRTYQDLRDFLGQLRAPLGIYAVNGNVEDPKWMRKSFGNLIIRSLNDEIVRFPELGGNIVLVGLSYRNWQDDNIVLNHLMGKLQPSDFAILLYHKPDLAYAARDTGVDLYLTGHTHGGQVRMPFYGALFSNSKYGKTFEMGLYHLGDMTLNVSRGIGFTGGDAPRARFLCPPEIVVVDLVPGAGGENQER